MTERLERAVQYSKAYKLNKLRQRIVSGLCAVAVFVTTYALILPAITQERATYCGFAEHTHGSDCASGCTVPEHIHSGDCYIDDTLLDGTQIEATLPKTLSGIWADDVVAIAESQIGYRESGSNMDPATGSGYTRYGAWYGSPYCDWSSVFTAFCLDKAGVDKSYFPYGADCAEWVAALDEAKLTSGTPKQGSIVFFRDGAGVNTARSAIVSEIICENDVPIRIKAVEGDSKNSVRYTEYSVNDEILFCYGDIGAAFNKYEREQPIIKTYSDGQVTVKAKCSPDSGIPRDAVLSVTVIDREGAPDEFEESYRKAFSLLEKENGSIRDTAITAFRLYDIHFEYDGREAQPSDSVDISISYHVTAFDNDASVSVLHYTDSDVEMPDSEHNLDDSGNIVTEFSTESFSLFAIVTSVSEVKSIVSLTQMSVTSGNVNSLVGPYAIIENGHALSASDGAPSVVKATEQSAVMTCEERAVRWSFTRSGSGYYVSTVENGSTYYINISDGQVLLTESRDEATLLTATRSGSGLMLSSESRFISLSDGGVKLADSQALSLYVVPSGEYTVIFDGQLGKAQYMGSYNYKYGAAEKVTVSTENGYVRLPTPDETKIPVGYPMRLNGWFDIINSVYYDSSMFGSEIKVTANTTFYAEWIPESYDIGQNKNVVAGQPDTSAFINTQVYDYNELFNIHSSYYNPSDKKWYFDTESGLGILFCDWISPEGNIGNVENKEAAIDGVTINVEKTGGTRGNTLNFPGTITAGIANEERINALFGSEPVLGRIDVGEADWLYSYDPSSGYYYYNSAKHAASYNQSEQRFYVYDNYVKIDNDASLHDFLPFNYAEYTGSEIEFAEKNNGANYWFGMKSEITFYLPHDSGVDGGNKTAFGEDMQFRFSGDDDVWVFVDGKLVLDLGGMHDVVYGEINFSTGEVRTGQAISSTNIAANSASTRNEIPGLTGSKGITTTTLDQLEGGIEHTLTVYYLERGSSLSNCAVYFNLSPLYQLSLTKEDSEGNNLLAGATFKVYSDEACTTPAILYYHHDDGTFTQLPDATFTTDENGYATCWGLFAGKTYYIKEINAPPGYSDMSEYVIEFSLSGDGQSVFIMIDSNGTQWEFAGQYVYTGGEEHLIELHVYNEKYIGGDGRLRVEKVWNDSDGGEPDSITVRLYANGERTNRTLTLSRENGWVAEFLKLPETDENGNKIAYTVLEENVHGYTAVYEEKNGEETVVLPDVEAWESGSTSLTSGNTYRFIYNGQALAINGTTLTMADISDDDPNQRWTVSGSGTSRQFKNVGTGRYMKLNRSSVATDTSSANVYYSNGVFGYSSSRRLYLSGSQLSINQRSYTTFTVERLTVKSQSTTVTYPGFLITNTPIKGLSIPVEKVWDATVAESERTEISLELYLVTIGHEDEPTLQGSLALNAENGWRSSFEDVPLPEPGSYYALIEAGGGFSVKYSGEAVDLTVNGLQKTAHRVSITDEGNAVEVTVTNSALLLLPETGGRRGAVTILGIILILLSAILLKKSTKNEENQ